MENAQPRLASFEDYRQRIENILATAETSIPVQPPHDTAALDLARVRMARVLTAYHLFAEREIFTPCTYALSDPGHKAQVRAVSAECAMLARDFRSWSRDCQDGQLIERWASYRPVALALMARVRRHLSAAQSEVKRCKALNLASTFCDRRAA